MDSTTARLGQAAAGAAGFTLPWWIQFMNDVSMVAGWVTSIGGAILTGYAVYRLVRRASA